MQDSVLRDLRPRHHVFLCQREILLTMSEVYRVSLPLVPEGPLFSLQRGTHHRSGYIKSSRDPIQGENSVPIQKGCAGSFASLSYYPPTTRRNDLQNKIRNALQKPSAPCQNQV